MEKIPQNTTSVIESEGNSSHDDYDARIWASDQLLRISSDAIGVANIATGNNYVSLQDLHQAIKAEVAFRKLDTQLALWFNEFALYVERSCRAVEQDITVNGITAPNGKRVEAGYYEFWVLANYRTQCSIIDYRIQDDILSRRRAFKTILVHIEGIIGVKDSWLADGSKCTLNRYMAMIFPRATYA